MLDDMLSFVVNETYISTLLEIPHKNVAGGKRRHNAGEQISTLLEIPPHIGDGLGWVASVIISTLLEIPRYKRMREEAFITLYEFQPFLRFHTLSTA